MFVGESPVTGVARAETKLSQHVSVMMEGGAYYACAIPLVWRDYWSIDYAEEGQVTLMQQLLVRLLPAEPGRGRAAIAGLGTSPHSSTRSGFHHEASFRDLKSAGCHWQRSRFWLPSQTTRLLLVLACACLWLLTQGTQVYFLYSLSVRQKRLSLFGFSCGRADCPFYFLPPPKS